MNFRQCTQALALSRLLREHTREIALVCDEIDAIQFKEAKLDVVQMKFYRINSRMAEMRDMYISLMSQMSRTTGGTLKEGGQQ